MDYLQGHRYFRTTGGYRLRHMGECHDTSQGNEKIRQESDYSRLSYGYLLSDESTVPVINNEKHRAVKGYIWLIRSIVVPMVFFHYHEGSRNAEVALRFFHDFKGAIQVDGYAGYDALAKLEGIMIMCCWAHCRRYFDRALKNDKLRAEDATSWLVLTSENGQPTS